MQIGHVTINFADIMMVVLFVLSLLKWIVPPKKMREIHTWLKAASNATNGGNENGTQPVSTDSEGTDGTETV